MKYIIYRISLIETSDIVYVAQWTFKSLYYTAICVLQVLYGFDPSFQGDNAGLTEFNNGLRRDWGLERKLGCVNRETAEKARTSTVNPQHVHPLVVAHRPHI